MDIIYFTNKKNTVTNNYPIPQKHLSLFKIKKTLPTATEKSPPSDAKDIDTALLAVATSENLSNLYKEGLFA